MVEEYSLIFEKEGSSPRIQKQFVEKLIHSISKIPFDSWSFTFTRSLESGKLNCSGCASLLGIIIEHMRSLSRIPLVEFVTPYGHAMNIIHFSDNSIYYADPRNEKFKNISNLILRTWNFGNLKVYRLKANLGFTGYRIFPAVSVREGVLMSYGGNLGSMYNFAQGKIDQVLKESSSNEALEADMEEAHEILQKHGYSKGDVKRARVFVQSVEQDMQHFYASNDFKEEVSRLGQQANVMKGVQDILAYVQKKPEVMTELISHINQIEGFLLFKTNSFRLPDKKLQLLFEIFRKSKIAVFDTNRQGYEVQIKKVCDDIRSRESALRKVA